MSDNDVHVQFGQNVQLRGAADWAAQVRDEFLTAMMFRTGNILVSEIWAVPTRRLTVRPWSRGGGPNAGVGAFDTRAAAPRGVPVPGATAGHGHTLGRGTGSSSVLLYTPGLFQIDTALRVPPFGTLLPGVTSREADRSTVLVHELAHALQNFYGARDLLPIPDAHPGHGGSGHGLPRGFGNSGELFAITVANVYQSERSARLHSGHRRPGVQRDGSVEDGELRNREFWREPTIYRHLDVAMHRVPRFATRMAQIDTGFNLFREIRAGVRPFQRPRDASGNPIDAYSG